jgi:NADH-quinone oxidoreductase subunit J
MSIYTITFYLFAAITVLSAFFVVTTRNIVHSAYYLMFTFFGVAGIYALLGADFIAIVQLVVYIGGILILLLFGVMLTNKITNVQIKSGTIKIVPASLAVALFAGIIATAMLNTRWKTVNSEMPVSTAHSLGLLLMQQYAVVFELLGILLLIALIGAASMARK